MSLFEESRRERQPIPPAIEQRRHKAKSRIAQNLGIREMGTMFPVSMTESSGNESRAPMRLEFLASRFPVAHRELIIEARNPMTHFFRMIVGAVILLGSSLLLWAIHLVGIVSGSGGDLFIGLAHVVGLTGVVLGTGTSANTLSSERKDGTLGLLFLTRLTTVDIVLGKLISSSVEVVSLMFGMLPALAICVLLGGVTPNALALTCLAILNILFFSLALGLLASALCRDATTAQSVAGFAALVFFLIIPVLAKIADVKQFLPFLVPWMEAISPYTSLRLGCGIGITSSIDYWLPMSVTHALTHAFFWGSVWLLPRNWQTEFGVKWKLFDFEKMKQARFGKPDWRKSFRDKALDQNPIFWVLTRDHTARLAFPRALMWLTIGLMAWACYDTRPVLGILPMLLFILEMQLKGMAAIMTAKQLMDDRESGALGLAFGAGVTLRQLADGAKQSVRYRMLPTFVAVQILIWLTWTVVSSVPLLGANFALENQWAGYGALLCCTLVSINQLPAIFWTSLSIPTVSRRPKQQLGLPMFITIVPLGLTGFSMIGLLLSGAFQGISSGSIFWLGVGVWMLYSLAGNALVTTKAKKTFFEKAGETSMQQPVKPKDNPFAGLAAFLRRRKEPKSAIDVVEEEESKHWAGHFRRWKWIAIAVVLVLAGLSIYNWRLNNQVEARLAGLEASGLLLDEDQIAALYPDVVAPNGNAAVQFTAAANTLVPLNKISTNSANAARLWKTDFSPLDPEKRNLRERYINKNAALIERLNKLQNPDECRFKSGVRFDYFWSRSNPDYNKAADVATLLQLAINMDLENGNTNRAFANLETLPRIAGIAGSEPSYRAQNARLAPMRHFRFALRNYVRREQLNEDQLARLDQAIDAAGRFSETKLRPSMQRDLAHTILQIREPDYSAMGSGNMFDYVGAVVMGSIDFLGFRHRKLLDYTDHVELALSAAASRISERITVTSDSDVTDFGGFFGWQAQGSLWRIQEMLDNSIAYATYLEIDRAVLTIERFRNANKGALPKNLEDLKANGLRIPIDPITDKPMKYRRAHNSYIIYSVGFNGADDGGIEIPGPPRRKPMDFVLEVRFDLRR